MTRTFRNAFTLIELLMVVAIMGLMGTLSVGGYRAMRRGMEESSVRRNVDQFIANAYQRAMIDRQPTAVFFWNEVRRDESDDSSETMLVVGRAVAVRLAGRVSAIDGNCLLDEFGDLAYFVGLKYDDDGNAEYDEDEVKDGAKTYIYRMAQKGSWDTCKSLASQATVMQKRGNTLQPLMTCGDDGLTDNQKDSFNVYGYYLADGVGKWKTGDAYGFEIADMTLPNNYIFGTSLNVKKVSDGPKDTGEYAWFYSPPHAGSSTMSCSISAVRPGKSGELEAQPLSGSTADPRRN